MAQVSFVLSQIARLTDKQTDGRTDSFIMTRLRCMHCMQHCKTELGLIILEVEVTETIHPIDRRAELRFRRLLV